MIFFPLEPVSSPYNRTTVLLLSVDNFVVVLYGSFGFMLCFGDLAWVPFIYSLQARYLVDHDPDLPLWAIAAILLVQALGYYIFR